MDGAKVPPSASLPCAPKISLNGEAHNVSLAYRSMKLCIYLKLHHKFPWRCITARREKKDGSSLHICCSGILKVFDALRHIWQSARMHGNPPFILNEWAHTYMSTSCIPRARRTLPANTLYFAGLPFGLFYPDPLPVTHRRRSVGFHVT